MYGSQKSDWAEMSDEEDLKEQFDLADKNSDGAVTYTGTYTVPLELITTKITNTYTTSYDFCGFFFAEFEEIVSVSDLPSKLLPDELLPNELLSDELLSDELMPDEVLPDEVPHDEL